MNTRILKTAATGDFHRKRIKPLLRLHGKWLERAGISAGCKVAVTVKASGVLEVRRLAETITDTAGYCTGGMDMYADE